MKLLRAVFRRFGYAIIPLDQNPELIIITIPQEWTGTFTVEPEVKP